MEKRNFQTNPVRVFIGVGHGGPDPGAVCNGLRESDCNLIVALAMEQCLQRHGVQVKLSRYVDEVDRLREEIAACNGYTPELAVEIHTNSGGGSGFELLCRKSSWEQNVIVSKLAQHLQERVLQCGMPVREIKFRSDLGWLNQTKAPAVICENFFVDGPKASVYGQTPFLQKLGQAYARAVLDLYGIAYWPENTALFRFSMVQPDDTRKEYSCLSIFCGGRHYVDFRQVMALFRQGVHWDAKTRQTLVYPDDLYSESDFTGTEPLKISDFPTQEEQLLNGIVLPEPISADYALEEYD